MRVARVTSKIDDRIGGRIALPVYPLQEFEDDAVLNPLAGVEAGGVALKGCSIIYAPAGQAAEYAALATNPYRGCGHRCAYCYVPGVLRMKRPEFDAGAKARRDFLAKLVRDAKKYEAAGITEQVML
jgi:hypothetical protein